MFSIKVQTYTFSSAIKKGGVRNCGYNYKASGTFSSVLFLIYFIQIKNEHYNLQPSTGYEPGARNLVGIFDDTITQRVHIILFSNLLSQINRAHTSDHRRTPLITTWNLHKAFSLPTGRPGRCRIFFITTQNLHKAFSLPTEQSACSISSRVTLTTTQNLHQVLFLTTVPFINLYHGRLRRSAKYLFLFYYPWPKHTHPPWH